MEILRKECSKLSSEFFRSYDQQVIKIDRENGLKGLQSEKARGNPGVTHMHTFLSGGEVFRGSTSTLLLHSQRKLVLKVQLTIL